jgi:hypothetical protein
MVVCNGILNSAIDSAIAAPYDGIYTPLARKIFI